MYEIEQMPWVERASETREICMAVMRAQSVLPAATSLVRAATKALVLLDLAASQYGAALERLQAVHGSDPGAEREPSVLADMVEAGARVGDRAVATRALRQLEGFVRIEPSLWGLGVLARSSALLAEDEDSEQLYLEAITHLTEAGARADVGRAHLLFGEWLRRKKRRAEARAHLRRARDLFVEMGAGCFAERADVELAATGERARKRTVDTQNHLTPQELHIATLAAGHTTNREIAQQLFISARTVEYHLHNIFQKLQISSRRQLPTTLARPSAFDDFGHLGLEAVG